MRTKLNSLMIVLALLAGVSGALAQVLIPGNAPAGQQSILYWPVSTTNYLLQTTANPAAPNWMTASNAVSINAVAVANTQPAAFFRLKQTTVPPGMVLIPAGWFIIGNHIVDNFYNTATNDPDITDAIPTNVYVSAFYMDVNLVTYTQWQTVYAYATTNGYGFDNPGSGNAANQPVYYVNWYDCVKWSNARSQQAGLTAVYYTDAALTAVYTNGDADAVYVNWPANGYRLPTEAEWEKAARGGLSGNRFPWGNFISESQANYDGDTHDYNYDLGPTGFNAIGDYPTQDPGTSPVGSFAPNGYGLYDMAGNLDQWCWDWYAGPPYPVGSPYLGGTDPRGSAFEDKLGYGRELRGGPWSFDPSYSRCAFRLSSLPNEIWAYIGFRCVRGL